VHVVDAERHTGRLGAVGAVLGTGGTGCGYVPLTFALMAVAQPIAIATGESKGLVRFLVGRTRVGAQVVELREFMFEQHVTEVVTATRVGDEWLTGAGETQFLPPGRLPDEQPTAETVESPVPGPR
jgi:hypothetical protein